MKFRNLLLAAGLFSFAGMVSAHGGGAHLEPKTYQLTVPEFVGEVRDDAQLQKDIEKLNRFIGSYPPRIASEEQREQVYRDWSLLLAETSSYANQHKNTQKSLYLQAELYRQGHNLNVQNSAKKAEEMVELCIQSYPKSVDCYFSASYLYVGIGTEQYLDKAEKHLLALRKIFTPKKDMEVESGLIFVSLYRKDNTRAIEQIDGFVENFPKSARTSTFKKIRVALMKRQVEVKRTE